MISEEELCMSPAPHLPHRLCRHGRLYRDTGGPRGAGPGAGGDRGDSARVHHLVAPRTSAVVLSRRHRTGEAFPLRYVLLLDREGDGDQHR